MTPSSRFFLSLSLFAGLALTTRADIERTVEKSFAVRPGGTVRVDTRGADISVMPSADAVVKIVAHERIRATTEAKANGLLSELALVIDQRGNDVTATARYGRTLLRIAPGSHPAVAVDFVVSIPAGYAAVLHTADGRIVVGNVAGDVAARSSGGDIVLGRIDGDIDARTSGGSISLDDGLRAVKLMTSGGGVSVGHAGGPAQFLVLGGDVLVGAVETSVQATAKGGNVRVGIAGPLKADSKLKSSGGGIKVEVDRSAGFRLDASAGGRVDTPTLNLAVKKANGSHSRVSGTVNGGGALLTLQSSGDDILIRTR